MPKDREGEVVELPQTVLPVVARMGNLLLFQPLILSGGQGLFE